MCKPQHANHLVLGVCKLSHTSKHIYAKNFLKIIECLNVKLHGPYEYKGCFYMNIKNCFIITNIYVIDEHAKFALEWQLLIEVKTITWAHNIQKHDHFPLWHFSYTFQSSPNYTAHISMGRDPYWKSIGLEMRLHKHIHIHKGVWTMLGVRWSHALLALPFLALFFSLVHTNNII